MRQYLFHGKRVDNDEWVEGYLNYNNARSQYYIMDDVNVFPIPVYKESVGEWTGMKDKNGKKIFENDIVFTQKRYNRPYSQSRKGKRHIGVVKYKVYELRQGGAYEAEWSVEVKDYGVYIHGSWGDFYDCEVIGTVFENADLLEG